MNRLARRHSIALTLVATAAFQNAQIVVHAATVRTVALSGQSAPGTPNGVNYVSFISFPVLNDDGQTAFAANITGGSGIWSESSGSLALVARTGSQAPGTIDGVTYGSFFPPVLNDSGQTAFRASLTGIGVDSTNNSGYWSEGSGSLALVARLGSQAPGTPGGVIYSFLSGFNGSPVLNNAGQIAFAAGLAGTGVDFTNDDGIWSERSGSLALVARGGNHAPGTLSGVNFVGNFSGTRLVLNNAGQTAFWDNLTDVNSSSNGGIWSEGSGSLALVARSGDHAPGTPSGVNFMGFGSTGSPVLNDAGQIVFFASLSDTGFGLWSNRSGSLTLIARQGDHAPGTPSGVFFNVTAGSLTPVINDAGQTAFRAGLAGTGVDSTNDQGIWSEGSGSLTLVAREGDHAPGTPSGVNYRDFGSFVVSSVLNDAGQTAFQAALVGIGVDSTNNQGIWATDTSGALQLIARSGDALEAAPGDLRTISLLNFLGGSGNSDGRPSRFNNLGQLAFSASFTDGSSGVFVSNLVAVPEPSSLLLSTFGILSLVMFRWRSAPCVRS